ncbi:hypothetical protein BV898_10008 [Hypsibius exemplaris]|uniref:BTB domain-containing protein n=1 Tax=Hypsibius exemplaris TaxID=2072580 RepID=A0A1W0WL63_HYPEX|nr:hypothetical protein BV898_10008 [Hypsibius exemplaris]
MFSKRTANSDRNAEDVEFDADSDSLIALELHEQLTTTAASSSVHPFPQDYQQWMAALLGDSRFKEYFDVEFKLKNSPTLGAEHRGSVPAHKLVLATRNRQFAELLRREKGREISLFEPDIPTAVFADLISYIYTGEIEFPRKVLPLASLLYAAKKYQVEPLYTNCKDWILHRIPRAQPRHLILLFQRALDLHLDDLVPLCSLLMEQRTVDTVKDPYFLGVKANLIGRLLDLNAFTGISEREMFERVLHWAHVRQAEWPVEKGKEPPTLRTILDPVIHKFCLASIPKDPLAAIITETGIFTEKEQLDISLFLLGRKKDLGQFSARMRKVNHKDFVAIQMAPPAQSVKPSKRTVKNGFKKLAEKSKSVTDLSKLGHEPTRDGRRRTSNISMPLGPPEHRFAVHADMNYFIGREVSLHGADDVVVQNIVANLPAPADAGSCCSNPSTISRAGEERTNWLRAATCMDLADSSADEVTLNRHFVRRVYRKTKLIPMPPPPAPSKPSRKGLNSIFSMKGSADI